jgi:hypothetical protein
LNLIFLHWPTAALSMRASNSIAQTSISVEAEAHVQEISRDPAPMRMLELGLSCSAFLDQPNAILDSYGDIILYYIPGDQVRFDALKHQVSVRIIVEAQSLDYIIHELEPGVRCDVSNASSRMCAGASSM